VQRTFDPGPGNGSVDDPISDYEYRFTYDSATATGLIEWTPLGEEAWFTSYYGGYDIGVPYREAL